MVAVLKGLRLRDLFAVLVVLVFMFPLFWWVLASFKPYTAIFSRIPNYFDFAATLDNYRVALLGASRINLEQGVGGQTGADMDRVEQIMKVLDRINRTGTTVLMATHDAAIVDSMRKRVVELEDGKIVRDQSRGVYGQAY